MSWKKQSSRTNTGNNTFVNNNYSLSTNLISEESKILGKGLFYNDVDICGNLTVGGTLVASNIDIELLTFENLVVSENLLVNGTLGVSGDVDFSNNLFVAGDISCNGELHFADSTYDNLTIENKLDVSGVDISNNLFVAGDISCNGELHFADLTYDNLTVENKLDVSGVDISNNLTIGGTISGDYLFVDGDRIHIGKDAGQINQGAYSVAIGYAAGKDNQNVSIAIGNEAGQSQKMDCIAIGTFAGQELQKESSIAIGKSAGKKNQGEYSVAIGYRAGDQDQSANSIILNAQDVSLNCDSSGLFIAPIRDLGVGSSDSLFYNATTKEVFYSTEGGGGSTFSDVTITNQLDVSGVDISNNLFVAGDISCNENLFVGGTGLAVIEEFELFCQGQTVATIKGNVSITNVTALQNTSTTPTYDTMNGSEISYNPPNGTTEVIYQFTFAVDSAINVTTLYFKFFIDAVEQTIAANGIRFFGNSTTTEKALRIPILIGPATDAAKCTLLNWTTAKTLKLEVSDWGVGHKGILYQNLDLQDPQVAFFVCPHIHIKAIKGPTVTY